MTPPVRVRQHADGRVAVCTDLTDGPYRWFVWPPHGRLTDEQVSGEGWCELLVTELPEPDGHREGGAPYWEPTYVDRIIVRDGELEDGEGLRECLEDVRLDALKMLAAVAACEQHRQEAKCSIN